MYRTCDDMLEKLPLDYVPREVKTALIKMNILQLMNIYFWFTNLLDRNTQFHTWSFQGKP